MSQRHREDSTSLIGQQKDKSKQDRRWCNQESRLHTIYNMGWCKAVLVSNCVRLWCFKGTNKVRFQPPMVWRYDHLFAVLLKTGWGTTNYLGNKIGKGRAILCLWCNLKITIIWHTCTLKSFQIHFLKFQRFFRNASDNSSRIYFAKKTSFFQLWCSLNTPSACFTGPTCAWSAHWRHSGNKHRKKMFRAQIWLDYILWFQAVDQTTRLNWTSWIEAEWIVR